MTYHFRATATNGVGTTDGADLTFTTISKNADLAALSLSVGALSPDFASATTSYSTSVSNAASSITVTPTTAESHATLTVNDASIAPGVASGPHPLNLGANVITVVVTAQDVATTKTYTVTVYRRTHYEDWALARNVTGANSAAADDFDFDDIANLLEWAFGTNPSQGSSGVLAAAAGVLTERGGPTTTGPDGARLAVFCRRLNHVAEGLTYTVEFSSTLGNWVPSTDTPTSIASDGEIEAVTVPYPAQVEGQPARFFRVTVTGE